MSSSPRVSPDPLPLASCPFACYLTNVCTLTFTAISAHTPFLRTSLALRGFSDPMDVEAGGEEPGAGAGASAGAASSAQNRTPARAKNGKW